MQPESTLPAVLILGDHLGYRRGVVHGATSYFLDVLPALKQAGLPFIVCFLGRPHSAATQLIDAGVTPIFLSASKRNPLVALQVAALVRKHQCLIIHAAGFKSTLIARIVGRLTGARVIVHLHDLLYPGMAIGMLQWLLARASDTGLCLSDAAREVAIRGYHVSPQRTVVAHNGVHLERFRQVAAGTRQRIRSELKLEEAAPALALIGRFHTIKGQHGMIKIMALIVKARPDVVLVLVGDGPERAGCEALGKKLGLQRNLRFTGQRSDVPGLLAAIDLVVVPSINEGLSLVAMESLAAGRPVVAYNVGGLPEVVTDGVDGRLVKAGDLQAFATAVLQLLADSEQLRIFGEGARQNSERFGLGRHVQLLLQCYRDIVR